MHARPLLLHCVGWMWINFGNRLFINSNIFIIIEQNHAQKGNGEKNEDNKKKTPQQQEKYMRGIKWIEQNPKCVSCRYIWKTLTEKNLILYEWKEGNE